MVFDLWATPLNQTNRENRPLALSLRPVCRQTCCCGSGAKENGQAIFRLIQKHFCGTFRKIQPHGMPRTSAKVGKQERAQKKHKFPIDTFSEKQPRGRPRKIEPSTVRGRADNYHMVFDLFWQHVWPDLSKAKTQKDVIQSFSRPEVGSYALDLIRSADLILQVVRDPKFPKRKRTAQITFLADSIAAYGVVTPRSSRDICAKERERIKRIHRILCYEFYIECSCGYKGHSRNHACPECEAAIPFSIDSPFETEFDS
jgi:hypothetical protein